MSETNKGPYFLFIGSDQKKIVERIDKSEFLDLHLGSSGINAVTPRMDLFLFAMALGMDTLPSYIKQKETFVRDEYVKTKHEAFLYSLFIYQMEDKEDFDSIKNKDKIYELAQEYANTGFDLIDTMMKTKSEIVTECELIKEMDQEYRKFFGEE